jgi:DNA-binding MltR family transcriptional regulator
MNKLHSKLDPLNDWNGFYTEIQNETPRASVIISAAFLDAQLRKLIAAAFIDDQKVVNELLGTEKILERPLSSFGARINVAYCMGLISRKLYEDLETVKRIRNRFAHKLHNYSFDEEEIVNWCKSLRLAKEITDAIPEFPRTHKNMFILGVTQLVSWIAQRTIEIEKRPKPLETDKIPGRRK